MIIFCLHHQLLQHDIKTELKPHKRNCILKYIFHFQNINSISKLVCNAEIGKGDWCKQKSVYVKKSSLIARAEIIMFARIYA